jgi:hypothetical protein
MIRISDELKIFTFRATYVEKSYSVYRYVCSIGPDPFLSLYSTWSKDWFDHGTVHTVESSEELVRAWAATYPALLLSVKSKQTVAGGKSKLNPVSNSQEPWSTYIFLKCPFRLYVILMQIQVPYCRANLYCGCQTPRSRKLFSVVLILTFSLI